MDGDEPARTLRTVVAADGAIMLPPEAAARLGAQPGDEVDVRLDGADGVTVVHHRRPTGAPVDFRQFLGIGRIPGGLTTDEYMRLIRDDPDA